MPNQKTKKNPHPHENWCLRVALRFCGRPKLHERFRQNRVVDAILFMPEPVDLWGPLAAFLSQRDLLIEHFSNSVNESNFASCQEKIAYASYRYSRVSLKDRGEKRHPAMAILSHRRPDRLLREPGLFEETEYQGIWVRRPMELGAMFLIAASHLSHDPAFDWLRLTTRVPETREELEKAESLLRRRKVDTLALEEMEDHMFILDGKTPKELLAENIRLEQKMLATEQEMLAAEREKLAAEQEKLAADAQRQAAEEKLAAFMAEFEDIKRQVEILKKH